MTKTLAGRPGHRELANAHAERAVLGAILLYPAAAPALVSLLDVTDFTVTEHRWVFLAASDLAARGQRCDPVNLAQELADRADTPQQLQTAAPLVHTLLCSAPAEFLAMTYATIVNTLAALRRTLPGPAPLRGFLVDDGQD